MGAIFNALKFKSNDRKAIAAKFAEMTEQARYEHGHSYSGSIGELSGAIQWVNLELKDETAANDWLCDHHEKYDRPMAVSFKNNDDVFWLVGGWCSE